MYLFVFVILLVSILGLYTNVFMLQLSHMTANQTVVASAMVDWHNAALATVLENPPTNAPCNLTTGYVGLPALPACLPRQINTAAGAAFRLPPGYNIGVFQFPSLAYKDPAAQFFVVTYLPYPVGAVGSQNVQPFNVGNGQRISLGHSVGEIYTQMQKSSVDGRYYGIVRGNRISTRKIEIRNGAGVEIFYDLPAGVGVPAGVAYITPVIP